MKRTAVALGALGLSLGLGAGVASAADTGSTVIDNIQRAAAQEDAQGAVQTAAGDMTGQALRECGLGALIGATTDEMSLKNVGVFVTAAAERVVALAEGPAAIVSLAASGCVERALLSFDVDSGSANFAGSVTSLALGGMLGTGSLAAASSDAPAGDTGTGSLAGLSSDAPTGDAAATGSLDSASAGGDSGSLDSGSLEESKPVAQALFAGAQGA